MCSLRREGWLNLGRTNFREKTAHIKEGVRDKEGGASEDAVIRGDCEERDHCRLHVTMIGECFSRVLNIKLFLSNYFFHVMTHHHVFY
jgi:hypothetical protein